MLASTANNAISNSELGAQFDQHFLAGSLTMRQVWNASWNVNTVGTQIMTATFVPLLLKSNDPRLLVRIFGVHIPSLEPNIESRDMSREHLLFRRVLKLATPPQTSKTDSEMIISSWQAALLLSRERRTSTCLSTRYQSQAGRSRHSPHKATSPHTAAASAV